MNSKTIMILGVTASGKSRLAFELAREIDAEIVSVDSMKVYRRMDIGTAKPSAEARRQVRYHMIDVVEPSESFSAGLFLDQASAAIDEIRGRGKSIVAVGGTALYSKALLYGLFEGPGSDALVRRELLTRIESESPAALHRELNAIDPVAAERISPNDAKRIVRALEVYRLTGRPISSLQRQFDAERPVENWTVVGLRRDKTVENGRINARVRKMVQMNLVDEVRSLLAEEEPLSPQARCAIGYAEMIEYIEGRLSLDDAIEQIKKNTRRLAKGQRTWFRRFADVIWIDVGAEEPADSVLERMLPQLD